MHHISLAPEELCHEKVIQTDSNISIKNMAKIYTEMQEYAQEQLKQSLRMLYR